jgi:lipopolysaccharide transport system permease protein
MADMEPPPQLPDPTPGPATPHLGTETLIRPAAGWQILNLVELWRYRDLLLMLTWRDISVRYKQTVLGVAWAILQPAAMMAVFAVVFGRLAKLPSGDVPYPLFVFAGLLPWTFFATAVTNAAHSVVENERLVTKVYFPRLAIPLAAIGAALVDFAIASTILAVLMACYGVLPGVSLLALPLAVVLLVLAAVGVGSLLAALNVSYRDFRYVVGFLVQLWMFGTPTIYMVYDLTLQFPPPATAAVASPADPGGPPETAGQRAGTPSPDPGVTVWDFLRIGVQLNPLTPLIATFRACTLGQPLPWQGLGVSALGSLLLFVLGLLYFRRVEDTFADVI